MKPARDLFPGDVIVLTSGAEVTVRSVLVSSNEVRAKLSDGTIFLSVPGFEVEVTHDASPGAPR